MTKDEVNILLDLIESKPIITSKQTDASTNKSKEDAWSLLTAIFNSRSGAMPRSREQLKAKWDNLKKAARKRVQDIRNNLKVGILLFCNRIELLCLALQYLCYYYNM